MSVASTVTTTHQPTGEDASISYSTKADVDIKVSALRETFRSGRAKDVRFRIWQLKQLYWMITDNHSAIVEVLRQDLGRHEYESCLSDINSLKDEIRHHVDHVHTWVRDEVPDSGFFFTRVGSTYIRQVRAESSYETCAAHRARKLTIGLLAGAARCGLHHRPLELSIFTTSSSFGVGNCRWLYSALEAIRGCRSLCGADCEIAARLP